MQLMFKNFEIQEGQINLQAPGAIPKKKNQQTQLHKCIYKFNTSIYIYSITKKIHKIIRMPLLHNLQFYMEFKV